MKVNVDTQFKGDHILARYRGPDSPEISGAILKVVLNACEEHQCFKILALGYLENSLSTLDNYDMAAVYAGAGFSSKYRMAWVDMNPETRESSEFGETVLFNRGFQVRLFDNEEHGRQWLLDHPTDVT